MYLLDASCWLCGYWNLWYLCDESCVGGTNGHQGSGGSKWLDWVWGETRHVSRLFHWRLACIVWYILT
jgi:hypothetical protein